MLNVIFYGSQKERTRSYKSYDTDGNEIMVTETEFYHTPSDFACQTMTSADGLFAFDEDIETFNGTLPSLTNGRGMFSTSTVQSISYNDEKADFSSLINGTQMCYNCSNLTTVKMNIGSLMNGWGMFSGCANLEVFEIDNLDSLTIGSYMFQGCVKMTSFSYKLDSLTNGYRMFVNCPFETFQIDLSSLTDGAEMFSGCTALMSFVSDLESLENGEGMFSGCTALTSFQGNLTSLSNGSGMFNGCKLDSQSVMYIIDSLPDYSDETTREITIGINCSADISSLDQFSANAGFINWTTLKSITNNKNWNVTWQDSSNNEITL